MPPGGLLNYVTKRPHADIPNEVEVQLGSDAMKQVAFDIGGALNENGTVLYRLTGLARNSDNFVDYIHDDRYYFAPALTWKPDEANELTVLTRWQKADTKNGAGFLPRTEEDTAELQSLMRISYAGLCLKKKKIHKYYTVEHTQH